MVAVSLKKFFFEAEDGIRDAIRRLVGSEMCIRDRVCVVCVGPLGAACVVLGGGCVWDVFLSGLTAGEGSGMVFRAAALVVVWLAGSAG